jgi:hypothetical protein
VLQPTAAESAGWGASASPNVADAASKVAHAAAMQGAAGEAAAAIAATHAATVEAAVEAAPARPAGALQQARSAQVAAQEVKRLAAFQALGHRHLAVHLLQQHNCTTTSSYTLASSSSSQTETLLPQGRAKPLQLLETCIANAGMKCMASAVQNHIPQGDRIG